MFIFNRSFSGFNPKRLWVFVFLALGILSSAADKGKIRGKITDAETGEALYGVNIILEGTNLGAASDEDGSYFIVGVPVGTYTLRVSYIGYQIVEVEEVEVLIDRTTEINVKLQLQTLELSETIQVIGAKPPIALDVSSSKRDVDLENLETAPLTDFNSVLNLQPSTFFSYTTNDASETISTQLTIRGGTGVGVYVDGLNVTEAVASGSMTNFNLSSLEAAEILTGGFNAEYGNIRSGVINVVTKEGGKDYHFSLDVKSSPSGRKHFGESIYDVNTAPEWKLYGTQEALYGEDGIHDEANPDSYWEYFSKYDTTYSLTPEQAQEVWKYQHRQRQYCHKPDYIVDGSLGGPVPLLGKFGDEHEIRFFTSLAYKRIMLAVPLARDSYTDLNWFWKITSKPTTNIKLTVQGNYQQNFSGTSYNTPRVSVTTVEQAVYSMQYPGTKYYDGMRSLADRYRNQWALSLTHVLSQKTYYEFKISYLLRRSFVYPAAKRSSAVALEVGGYTFDSSPQGGWVAEATVQDFGGRESDYGLETQGMSFTMGGNGKERDYSRENLVSSKFDLVSQVNETNLIKGGLEFNYEDMNIYYGIVRLSPPLNSISKFRRTPIRASAYIQDKIEFKGMIVNLGLRYDYTDRQGSAYSTRFSKYFTVDSMNYIPNEPVNIYGFFSPRVGVSHPISDKSKLFFNYGHFYSEPSVDYLYTYKQNYEGDLTIIPNANLRPEKTVAYEVGFEQQLGEEYLFHISGYYRDITNQIKEVYYYNTDNDVVTSYTNENYADIRGFEAIFEKKAGDFFVGSLSLDYLVKSTGDIGFEYVYEDEAKTTEESTAEQSTPGPDYNFIANITFKTPDDFCKSWLGSSILGNWYINIIHVYRSGRSFTWNPESKPGVKYNVRWVPHINTDLRVSKRFELLGVNWEGYCEVKNVFNRKELVPFLRSLLLPQLDSWNAYMNSLSDDDQPGDYKADNIVLPDDQDFPHQLLFLNPRDIYFGVKINF